MNHYRGGLDVPDDVALIASEACRPSRTMQAIVHSSSRLRIAAAPGMSAEVESAGWNIEGCRGAVVRHLRDMPWDEQKPMLPEVGLDEPSQDAAT